MDAFVDKLTTQLNLAEDENRSIVFERRPIGNNRQAQCLFLVGRLLSLKNFIGTILYEDHEEALVTKSLCRDLPVGARATPIKFLSLHNLCGLELRVSLWQIWRGVLGNSLGIFIEIDSGRGGWESPPFD
ncbi:unnamed protein product [Prunus armeniaca]|uniref:Uncharacterized protein n=1 Tax=Prunus armeniaca TaxID=36596 RepID=A0A6J5V0V1_PRUAR|nr:unnamed protein product [Prunus armeniaca]CAB4312137.1 unnamed protein product [Prunus armeniaca]